MSGNQTLANRYREVAINTANPLQLVVILYDAAIHSLRQARDQIEHGDIAGRSRSINKCTAIISELQACLNIKAGGEIADSLNRLYDYIRRRIFKANIEQSAEPLLEAETLLENLRSAWSELAAQSQESSAQIPMLSSQRLMHSDGSAAAQLKSLNISG